MRVPMAYAITSKGEHFTGFLDLTYDKEKKRLTMVLETAEGTPKIAMTLSHEALMQARDAFIGTSTAGLLGKGLAFLFEKTK